jgi:hypothetical protein
LDAAFQNRVAAVAGHVINGKPWPVVLAAREKFAPVVQLHRLVRVEHCRRVKVRAYPWMRGVRDIEDDGAAMLLQRIVGRRVVGTMVRPGECTLRFRSLTPELAHEFEVAVVAFFRIAAEAFLSGRLTLHSTLGPIFGATIRLGCRSGPRNRFRGRGRSG